jgi:hypothetical protein
MGCNPLMALLQSKKIVPLTPHPGAHLALNALFLGALSLGGIFIARRASQTYG